MTQNDIKDYIQLGILVNRIEAIQSQIEVGDMHYTIAAFDRFPFFQSEELLRLRKDAMMEYYQNISLAFYSACKLSYEKEDENILKAIDACVVKLSSILANAPFQRQQLPLVNILHKLYETAITKLKKNNHIENASHLECLRKLAYMGWNIIR